MNTTRPTLHFWFDLGSPYSYLSVARIEALVAGRGLNLVWRPFLLGPIFKAQGWQDSPFNEDPPRLKHMWIDVARQARKYGVPFQQPGQFPRRGLLATRIAVLAADAPWLPEYCRRVMHANFVANQEMDSPETLAAATRGLVPDHDALLASALSDTNKEATRLRTEEARQLGLFGAPSFMVGEELFWGDDRLEDALSFALGADHR